RTRAPRVSTLKTTSPWENRPMHEWCGRWEQRRRKAKRAHRESAPVRLDVQPPGQGHPPASECNGGAPAEAELRTGRHRWPVANRIDAGRSVACRSAGTTDSCRVTRSPLVVRVVGLVAMPPTFATGGIVALGVVSVP